MHQQVDPTPEKKTEVGVSAQEKKARFETFYRGWNARKLGLECVAPFGVALGKNTRWREGWVAADTHEKELAREEEALQALKGAS